MRRGGLTVAAMAVALAVALTGCGGSGSDGGGGHGDHGGGAMAGPTAGSMAPPGSFTTVSGRTETLASMRGRPALVWLVTTWCPVCQAGTRAMTAGLMSSLARMHVRVLELEVHGDLGHPNPTMTAFVRKYAGAGPYNPDWTFGTASAALTRAYDPKGEMDVYYLLDSTGHVVYVNSGPAATGPKLLAHAANLS
jgi:thiol-disulfide isomerase/thioredoxin